MSGELFSESFEADGPWTWCFLPQNTAEMRSAGSAVPSNYNDCLRAQEEAAASLWLEAGLGEGELPETESWL